MISRHEIITIYDEHKDALYYYIYKLVRHEDTAEDILQDCFEKFIKYTTTREVQKQSIKNFLYATAHHLSLNHIKRRKIIDFVEIQEYSTSENNVEHLHNELEKEELELKIDAILETCSPEAKSIFILNKKMNMNYEEIARHIGISARTVRRRMQQTINIIMNTLEKEGFI